MLASGVHVDLLFTGVVMPGPLKSPEMATRAVRMMPGLKVLFTSGYTQSAIVHGGRLDPGVELLSKPYSRQQLAAKVRQILDDSDRKESQRDTVDLRDALGVLRVLVVDDDKASLDAVCEVLALLDIRPVRAGNAAAALDALRAADFDILLTDVVMPDMSGLGSRAPRSGHTSAHPCDLCVRQHAP